MDAEQIKAMIEAAMAEQAEKHENQMGELRGAIEQKNEEILALQTQQAKTTQRKQRRATVSIGGNVALNAALGLDDGDEDDSDSESDGGDGGQEDEDKVDKKIKAILHQVKEHGGNRKDHAKYMDDLVTAFQSKNMRHIVRGKQQK